MHRRDLLKNITVAIGSISFSEDSLSTVFPKGKEGDSLRNNFESSFENDINTSNYDSIFSYLSHDKMEKIISGESIDVTKELNFAMQSGGGVFLPDGNYIITDSILVGINSSLIGSGARTVNIDNHSDKNAFVFPVSYSRGYRVFTGFTIKSSSGKAIDKYAFYFPGGNDDELKYSVGWKFCNIELIGYGMGGGWFLQDCFRVIIRDCGSSGLSNPFYVYGSVVQLLVDNFINNGDNQPNTSLGSYGVYMMEKKYRSNKIMFPEGVVFINSSFVQQRVGARVLGLHIQFLNTEFDYSWEVGGLYAGGDKVDFINCYVGCIAKRDNDFYGFKIPPMANNPEPVSIINCTINLQGNHSGNDTKTVGISIGGEIAKCFSTRVIGCFFKGGGYNKCLSVVNSYGVVVRDNTFSAKATNLYVRDTEVITVSDNFGCGLYDMVDVSKSPCWIVTGNVGELSGVKLKNKSNSLIVNSKGNAF